MILEVKRNHLEKIRAEALKTRAELCGFIIGRIEGNKALAVEFRRARNVLNSAIRFQIDPQEFLRVLGEVENRTMDIIGFYHSHPSLASPSAEDEKFMSLWPDKIWLIVSSINGDARAFVYKGRIEEIRLKEI